jgi:predicted DNA-binding transcriptional regulator
MSAVRHFTNRNSCGQAVATSGEGNGLFASMFAHLRYVMANPECQYEFRVWASLALHTMGFQQELAVRMDKGVLAPLRQIDIAKETGIDVRHVQTAIRNLEKQGLVTRQGKTKGEVKILCQAPPSPSSPSILLKRRMKSEHVKGSKIARDVQMLSTGEKRSPQVSDSSVVVLQ